MHLRNNTRFSFSFSNIRACISVLIQYFYNDFESNKTKKHSQHTHTHTHKIAKDYRFVLWVWPVSVGHFFSQKLLYVIVISEGFGFGCFCGTLGKRLEFTEPFIGQPAAMLVFVFVAYNANVFYISPLCLLNMETKFILFYF